MSRDVRREGSSRPVSRIERAVRARPERFARPLTLLLLASCALLLFGFVMIYSASSIVALSSKDYGNNAAYFVIHQLAYAGVGLVLLLGLAKLDYHVWGVKLLPVLWVISLVLLAIVRFTSSGSDSYGATRWVSLAGFRFQPSEFAKIVIVLTGANVAQAYFEDDRVSLKQCAWLVVIGLGLPLALIFFQPDKGTTLICVATLFVMLYLSGVPGKPLLIALAVVGVIFLAYALRDDYSRQRIYTLLNPWADPLDSGYQILQGFYAFASGGMFGVGIGASRQKYSYLPFAHNDFIFAVVGEECGLVGTLGVVAGFAVIFWAGLKISRNAPDLAGRLIAAGCTSLLVIQFFVNVCGVLALLPMTGKPVPFLSYGGSSIISTLMAVGVVCSVALHSSLDETESDRRREDFSLMSRTASDQTFDGDSQVGAVTPRRARNFSSTPLPARTPRPSATPRASTPVQGRFQVFDGGAADDRRERQQELQSRARLREDSSGRRRIDLGPDAAERLRPQHTRSTNLRTHRTQRSDRRGR